MFKNIKLIAVDSGRLRLRDMDTPAEESEATSAPFQPLLLLFLGSFNSAALGRPPGAALRFVNDIL